MLEPTLSIIRDRLIEAARDEKPVIYQEVGTLVGLSMGSLLDRTCLSEWLDEIAEDEHEAGRPLLSAVVVRKRMQRPGAGFFELARQLGEPMDDEEEYCLREPKAVFEYWRERSR